MKYEQDIPVMPRGIEPSQICFSGGRIAASIAPHGGLTHLDYYGAQRVHDTVFYRGDPISAWKQLFRLCVRVDNDLYVPEFNTTTITPLGYESTCRVDGVLLCHGMLLLNDALVYTVEVVENMAHRKVALRLLHMGCSREGKTTRQWRGFVMDQAANLAHAVVTDHTPPPDDEAPFLAQVGHAVHAEPEKAETHIGITATKGLRMGAPVRSFQKWTFTTVPFERQAAIAIVFGHQGADALARRAGDLQAHMFSEVAARKEQHRVRLAVQPTIRIQNPVVQSALRSVMPVLDSVRVGDIPGALRAADSGYWVWGWDTMVHADAHGFGNDVDTLVDVLDFYRRSADSDLGIFHAMTLEGKPMMAMAPAAQCLYAILLYQTYLFNGDVGMLAEYFPFARAIVDRAGVDEISGCGLVGGVSLFPDYPEDLEQDGHDISVFNNSIYFQALRAMAALAAERGDPAVAADFTARADRLQSSFSRFFDENKGYFVDSLSSRDFSPRRHYPSYAVLWVTPFAAELVAPWRDRIAAFMKDHLAARRGVRMFPKWDSRFMYDGNQLGASMPVVENTYRELRRSVGDDTSAAELLGNIEWYWNQLCIPEGLTCEYENHGLTPDNPGRKQPFCAKAWLTMFYHVIAGLSLDCAGLVFVRGSGIDLGIKGLVVRGHVLDIEVAGAGPVLAGVTLNGEPVDAPYRIPFAMLQSHNTIIIRNGDAPRAR